MASIILESNGRRLIQLSPGEHTARPKIRLGKVSKRESESVRCHIENLVRAQRTGTPFPAATADWLATMPGGLRQRLEKVGLVGVQQKRESLSLGQWLGTYIDGRQDVKEATTIIYSHTQRNLLTFFGETTALVDITSGDADAFRVHLVAEESLADNTVRRRMGIAGQFFRAAVRRKFIAENPFDGQATCVRENPKRQYFVSLKETEAVLAACPNAKWRLAFAMARYGGLRCASEITRLTWGDINWERDRFTVHSVKTEHHDDAGIRVVPIFPELRPHLRDAFEAAEPGDLYCCPQFKDANTQYRRVILQAINKAGLVPWPKLFQNCRSSRETELAEAWPLQVVCAWIGNSPRVAMRHYLMVTDDHFNKAVHDTVQTVLELPRTASQTGGDGG